MEVGIKLHWVNYVQSILLNQGLDYIPTIGTLKFSRERQYFVVMVVDVDKYNITWDDGRV